MRKIIFIFCFVSCFINNVSAQNFDVSDLVVGGKIGASASKFTSVKCDPMFGAYGTAYAEIYIKKGFAMDIELSMIHKGARNIYYSSSKFDENKVSLGPYEYRLDFLTTSYLAKYYITNNIGLYGGVNASIMFNAKAENNNHSVNIKDQLHRGEIGAAIGVEYVFKNKYTIDARYNFGINKLPKTKLAKDILGNTHVHNISITFGYKFLVF